MTRSDFWSRHGFGAIVVTSAAPAPLGTVPAHAALVVPVATEHGMVVAA